MPEVTFIPDRVKISVKPGTTLLNAAFRARVRIPTRCGGKAACLMCKVKVPDQTGLSPLNQQERLKLGDLADDGYRLACQACVKGNVEAQVPEDPLKAAVRAQLEQQRKDDSL